MRIALITLALVALGFIGTIIYSIALKDGGMIALPKSTKSTTIQDSAIALETLKYQIKTDEKLDELNRKIESLNANSDVSLGVTSIKKIESSSTGSDLLPISGKFLAQVMPTLEFSVIENNGIYDLHIFDLATPYTTYSDIKFGAILIVTKLSYDTILKNFKALGDDVYSVNESKTFPFRSFYLNPPKSDTLVRIVLEIESQAIIIQIPKTKFNNLKSLLLKKDSTK